MSGQESRGSAAQTPGRPSDEAEQTTHPASDNRAAQPNPTFGFQDSHGHPGQPLYPPPPNYGGHAGPMHPAQGMTTHNQPLNPGYPPYSVPPGYYGGREGQIANALAGPIHAPPGMMTFNHPPSHDYAPYHIPQYGHGYPDYPPINFAPYTAPPNYYGGNAGQTAHAPGGPIHTAQGMPTPIPPYGHVGYPYPQYPPYPPPPNYYGGNAGQAAGAAAETTVDAPVTTTHIHQKSHGGQADQTTSAATGAATETALVVYESTTQSGQDSDDVRPRSTLPKAGQNQTTSAATETALVRPGSTTPKPKYSQGGHTRAPPRDRVDKSGKTTTTTFSRNFKRVGDDAHGYVDVPIDSSNKAESTFTTTETIKKRPGLTIHSTQYNYTEPPRSTPYSGGNRNLQDATHTGWSAKHHSLPNYGPPHPPPEPLRHKYSAYLNSCALIEDKAAYYSQVRARHNTFELRDPPCEACVRAVLLGSREACHDATSGSRCCRCFCKPGGSVCTPIAPHIAPVAKRLTEAMHHDRPIVYNVEQLKTAIRVLLAIPAEEFHSAGADTDADADADAASPAPARATASAPASSTSAASSLAPSPRAAASASKKLARPRPTPFLGDDIYEEFKKLEARLNKEKKEEHDQEQNKRRKMERHARRKSEEEYE